MRLSITLYVVCVPLSCLFHGWLKYCSTYCRQPASLTTHLVSLYERPMYVLTHSYLRTSRLSRFLPMTSHLLAFGANQICLYVWITTTPRHWTRNCVLSELRLRQIVRNLWARRSASTLHDKQTAESFFFTLYYESYHMSSTHSLFYLTTTGCYFLPARYNINVATYPTAHIREWKIWKEWQTIVAR